VSEDGARDDGRQQRQELGSFLRRQRERLDRTGYGLPPAGRGRAGLRREEVSYLSGVSVTWYTWLEQGRDINPSRQVLDAVATALRLTNAEHDYVLSLVGLAPRPAARADAVETAPEHVQRFLDALDEHPAYALAPDWGSPDGTTRTSGCTPGWPRPRRKTATCCGSSSPTLGAIAARRLGRHEQEIPRRVPCRGRTAPGRPTLPRSRLRLSAASTEFRARWNEHGVGGFVSRERVFRHPQLGRLVFEHHQLRPSDHLDLQLVVYVADAETRRRFGAAS
jgi:transcriptional regulator with XRE-family HTH domain